MRIVLLGPQGAGKGTQAQRLTQVSGAHQISTGDLVRAEIAAGTFRGRQIQEYNERGELVPDAVILALALPRVLESTSWILDGFPRTAAQAHALESALAGSGQRLDRVIALEAPDDEILDRLAGRRQSQATGRIYHLRFNPPPPDDPGPFVQRSDDKPEQIRRRLALYHAETQPLKQFYAQRGLLCAIDALQPIDAVTAAILRASSARTPKGEPARLGRSSMAIPAR